MKGAPKLNYGRAIRLLCARDNYDQRDLAKALGCATSYVSLLANGHRTNPSSLVLTKMAKFFRCSVSELISLAEGKGGVYFGERSP